MSPLSRRQILQASAAAGAALLVGVRPLTSYGAVPVRLKKWVDPLAIPPAVTGPTIEMSMVRSTHQFHSGLAASSTLAYRCDAGTVVAGAPDAVSYLGPTIVATTGVPLTVRMVNRIAETGGHPLPIDTTTIPDAQVADTVAPRTSTHLHGGNTHPAHDGGPEDDFRDEHTYVYDNTQDATGIWYHDHAIGITRINVYAGLAGGYLIRDTDDTGIDTGLPGSPLPTGKYEVPLIIQDKLFDVNGQQFYDGGAWVPEFFGDTPVVNGTAWPYLAVDQGVYRFRAYNGSNARFYRLGLKVKSTGAVLPFFQIGSDGGLLNIPVPLTQLVLGPGERADLLVDFRGLRNGELVEMGNNAPTPYPDGPRNLVKGGAPLPQVMQFRVTGAPGFVPATPIAGTDLRPKGPIVRLDAAAGQPGVRIRSHSLVEIMGANGPRMALLNNRSLHNHDYAADDQAIVADTLEVWEFVNTTVDAHPIHLHLVQFQVLNRQPVDAVAYLAASGYEFDQNGWLVPDSGPHPAPSPTPYLLGAPLPPPANELGWKDTVVAPPGMVTRIAVPFGAGAVSSPIAARAVHVPDHDAGENDYVWHCHILEHEENEMMQYYRLVAPTS